VHHHDPAAGGRDHIGSGARGRARVAHAEALPTTRVAGTERLVVDRCPPQHDLRLELLERQWSRARRSGRARGPAGRSDLDLLPSDFVTGGRPRELAARSQRHSEVRALSIGQRELRDGYLHAAGRARCDRERVELAGRHLVAVDLHRPPRSQPREIHERVLVRDFEHPARGVDRPHLHRLDHFGELEQRRVGRAVGGHEPVAHERTVVGLVAEVAAVREALGSVGERLHERLVDPIPDESALQAGIRADRAPVVVEAAAGVAHRVDVLAHDQRARRSEARRPIHEVMDLRVHRRDHIGLGALAGEARGDVALVRRDQVFAQSPFVVHRPGRVPRAQPRGGRDVNRRRATLVAERPHDDRGVVLVALGHARDPLEHGGVPARIFREAAKVRVSFDVGLVEHVQAEAVADVVEVRVIRVVRRAHRVDVVPLHQHHVGLDRRARHRLAPAGVVIVAVDAFHEHGLPVHEQLVAAHLHPPEPDRERHGIHLVAVRVDQRDRQVVPVRRLRAPRRDAGHGQRGAGTPALEPEEVHDPIVVFEVDRGLGLLARNFDARPPTLGRGGDRVDIDSRVDAPVACVGVVVGNDVQVGDEHRRRRVQEDAPVQTGVKPMILVFQIGRVRPSHNREGEIEGVTRPDDPREIEFVREP
jgi:hypothetical protein